MVSKVIRTPAKRVVVYNGAGVGAISLRELEASLFEELGAIYKIERISAAELLEGNWIRNTTLLAIPGGRDLPYLSALQEKGSAVIRNFVESGGRYLGICAGAYFAASAVDFERGTPLEVIGDRPLKLFEGTATGPAFGVGTYDYLTPKDARVTTISWDNLEQVHLAKSYYSGGCRFEDVERSKILGRYEELEGKPPAIIRCEVGKGAAVLSGVHPEFSAKGNRGDGLGSEAVVKELRLAEEARRSLFQRILGALDL